MLLDQLDVPFDQGPQAADATPIMGGKLEGGPALHLCQGAQEHGRLAGSDLLGGLDRHHRRPHMGSAALGHLLTAASDPMR